MHIKKNKCIFPRVSAYYLAQVHITSNKCILPRISAYYLYKVHVTMMKWILPIVRAYYHDEVQVILVSFLYIPSWEIMLKKKVILLQESVTFDIIFNKCLSTLPPSASPNMFPATVWLQKRYSDKVHFAEWTYYQKKVHIFGKCTY